VSSAVFQSLGSVVSAAVSEVMLAGGCMLIGVATMVALRNTPPTAHQIRRALVELACLYSLVIPISALGRLIWLVRAALRSP
jgi:hypothetical protein